MGQAKDAAMGSWLRDMREARGEPLRAVAASVGLDPATLSKIERGDRLATGEQTSELAEHFGIPAEELQARRIATDFLGRYGAHPGVPQALGLIRESLANRRRLPGEAFRDEE